MTAEAALKILLRWIGTASIIALVFVAAPHAWMDSIHRDLGMGPLPDAPVVGYLARSTSALYALLGGLFWVLSFDLARHRKVLVYLGRVVPILGVILFAVDRAEGLPLFWQAWEGPALVVIGLVIFFLGRRIRE